MMLDTLKPFGEASTKVYGYFSFDDDKGGDPVAGDYLKLDVDLSEGESGARC